MGPGHKLVSLINCISRKMMHIILNILLHLGSSCLLKVIFNDYKQRSSFILSVKVLNWELRSRIKGWSTCTACKSPMVQPWHHLVSKHTTLGMAPVYHQKQRKKKRGWGGGIIQIYDIISALQNKKTKVHQSNTSFLQVKTVGESCRTRD